jgi:Skp family chaperone for outer membrane proteins
MTSVLNVGVMRGNPVGNQIRSLQLQLDDEKKNFQMLLSAMESKAPEVLAEYTSMKEASVQESQNAQNSQNSQNFSQNSQNFNQGSNQNRGQQPRNSNGRF